MFHNIQKKIIYFIFIYIFYIEVIHSKLNTIIITETTSNFCNTYSIEWQFILLRMLENVFFFNEIAHNSTVLVNIFKNDTNGLLQTVKITSALIELIIENTNKYTVISLDELYQVYRKLEMSLEENFNSYEFAIKIANYLTADYIIYGIAYGDSNKPDFKIQLIFSKTGEILKVVDSNQ